jgi:SanA protein
MIKHFFSFIVNTIRRFKYWIVFLGMASLVLMYWCDVKIKDFSSPYISSDFNVLPPKKVGLLLGSSKLLKSGKPNPYFKYRIEAAVELFNAKKVSCIIVSGDNSIDSYNEPLDMQQSLIAKGIPDSCIILDYAGLRTLDSMLRLEDIFCQTECIVISQTFHLERAIYLARKNNILAYGYPAKDVNASTGIRTQIREKFARLKAALDVMFHKKAKYSGEKLCIE